jgi:hypothetical protein
MSDADVIVQVGEALWNMALDAAGNSRHTWRWMKEPHLGDFVLVWMTSPNTPAEQRVGIFDSTWCYIHPEEPHFPLPAQQRAEQIYRIILLDGKAMNWSNCQLLRLPRTREERLDSMYMPCGDCGAHVGHFAECTRVSWHHGVG